MAGQINGQKTIPLARDLATAPYAVFQRWGDQQCYDADDGTVKAGATYANCAVRFDQDAVTAAWFLTIPSTLTNGTYLVLIRDGADGAEANTDTEVSMVVIEWSRDVQSFKVVQDGMFYGF